VTTSRPAWHPGSTISWLVVGAAGLVEGLYGRTAYLGDWISYLNVSRAVSTLDWPGIFNPMWSPGYPALVAVARSIAPLTPEGEWYAITFLNWVIFLGAYACWRYLIRSAVAFYRPASIDMANHPVAIWTGCAIFLACNLGLNNVSAVSPDLLVTACFILATGQTLTLLRHPTRWSAASLGIVLGTAIWIKGVFISFAGVFLLTILLDRFAKRSSWRSLGIAAGVFGVLFGGYVAAISWSYGDLTFGASGALNYAWHVNHLPHWTNWEGGSSKFGAPVHPTRQLVAGLPVFEFASPFQTTYPPYNNVAYWYQGFRQFFSLKLQLIAIARSIYFLVVIAVHQPILICAAAALLMTMFKRQWRRAVWKTGTTMWPLFLVALAGFGTYVAVHMEDRYLSAFVLIFTMLPLAPLLDPNLASRKFLGAGLVLIFTTGAIAELVLIDGATFWAALHRADFHDDPQWRLAAALSAHGLNAGDPVAVIRDSAPPYLCSWAYVSRLRIVAEFGALPWRQWIDMDRTKFDRGPPEPAFPDYAQLFWTRLSPQQQAQIIEAFHTTGARAIVSLSKPPAAREPGWLPLNGTGAWIYEFPGEYSKLERSAVSDAPQ
jgi:hypothetical protein